MPRLHVVVEQAAVIHDARDEVHLMFHRGGQHETAGPGFERIQNNHRPVEQRAEALEAKHEIEGEPVGRAGRDAEAVRKLPVA